MFIYNFKINGTKFFKVFFTVIVLIVVCIMGIAMYRIFSGAGSNFFVSDSIDEKQVFKIESNNYTNILKTVHENIDTYVGKKILFTGYLYRVSDLESNQFILARNMIISSDFQYLIVGFISQYDKISDFKDSNWIEITAEVTKGSYHGSDMPILKVMNIKNADKPNDEFVYPPDESYIPTSSVL